MEEAVDKVQSALGNTEAVLERQASHQQAGPRLVMRDGVHLFDPTNPHHKVLAQHGAASTAPGQPTVSCATHSQIHVNILRCKEAPWQQEKDCADVQTHTHTAAMEALLSLILPPCEVTWGMTADLAAFPAFRPLSKLYSLVGEACLTQANFGDLLLGSFAAVGLLPLLLVGSCRVPPG